MHTKSLKFDSLVCICYAVTLLLILSIKIDERTPLKLNSIDLPDMPVNALY